MNRIIKFIKMDHVQRRISLCAMFYSKLHKLEYKSIGKKSYIYKPIIVTGKNNISIGDYVGIWQGARIECISEWKGEILRPEINIGNGCMFGQGLHMTTGSKIDIGDNVVVSSYCMITSINHSFDVVDLPPLSASLECSDVYIGANSLIGTGAKIMPGVSIGKNCVVGAGAVVTKDVPDYSIVAGMPAKVIRYYDEGSKRWKKII